MTRKILKNKPLMEAIFDLRWELQESKSGMRIDPNYKILIGRIYERVNKEYFFFEQLPTVTMPDEIAAYIVQHRFRKDKDKWPLIQIGPGVVTLNDTDSYVWDDFEQRIVKLLDALFDAYPDSKDNLKINGLLLRYIDAIDFNYENDDVLDFLKGKMKLTVDVHRGLFDNTGVTRKPLAMDLRFSYPSTKPKGAIHMRFGRGKRKDCDALIWETMIQSIGEEAPKTKEEIIQWAKVGHNLVDDWFFKIIEGELLKRFE